jgi:hypothetical protein
MKWTRGDVALRYWDGAMLRSVKAWRAGPFAVHRDTKCQRFWQVTHAPTGYHVVRHLPRLTDGQRLAERLNRLKGLDWSFTTPVGPKWIKVKRAAGPIVIAARRRYKDL